MAQNPNDKNWVWDIPNPPDADPESDEFLRALSSAGSSGSTSPPADLMSPFACFSSLLTANDGGSPRHPDYLCPLDFPLASTSWDHDFTAMNVGLGSLVPQGNMAMPFQQWQQQPNPGLCPGLITHLAQTPHPVMNFEVQSYLVSQESFNPRQPNTLPRRSEQSSAPPVRVSASGPAITTESRVYATLRPKRPAAGSVFNIPVPESRSASSDFGRVYSPGRSSSRSDLSTQTGPKRSLYTCGDCDFKHSRKKEWKRHRSVYHQRPTLLCSYCAKTFTRKDNMDRHIRNKHRVEYNNRQGR